MIRTIFFVAAMLLLGSCRKPAECIVVDKSVIGDWRGRAHYVVVMKCTKTGQVKSYVHVCPDIFVSVNVGDTVMY